MTNNDTLTALGLTHVEQEIYTAFLESGETVASMLAKKYGFDKSTTYRVAENLVTLGLLLKNPKERGTTYTPTNPESINNLYLRKKQEIINKEDDVQSLVERLKKSALSSKFDSYITVERGYEAHKKALMRSVQCKERLLRSKISTKAPIYDNPEHEEFIRDHYMRVHKKRHVFFKQLVQYEKSYVFDDIVFSSKKLNKEVRILSEEFESEDSWKIYDDYVDITIYPKDEPEICISIHNTAIAQIMKEHFDYIWRRSAEFFFETPLPIAKKTNSIVIPKIGMGSRGFYSTDARSKIGYMKINRYYEERFAIDQIMYGLGKGITYLDTCTKYSDGEAVKLIGRAIKHYPRRALTINAKLTQPGGIPVKSVAEIEKQCDQYLKDLNTDYVDIFQIHSPRGIEISIEETITEMERLVKKGKIRAIGVSNFDVSNLKEALKASKTGIIGNEIPYNLAQREYEKNGTIDFCNKHGILVMAYWALGLGRLAGLEDLTDQFPLMVKLCQKYDRSSVQIALNWLLNKPNLMAVIKSTNASHLNENVASLGWKMAKSDYELLDKAKVQWF